MRRDGSQDHLVLDSTDPYFGIAWGPDVEWLAAPGFDGGVWLVHPDGSDAHMLVGTEEMKADAISWFPGGSGYPLFFTAWSQEDESQQVWYVAGPDEEATFFVDGWGPVWAPDGSRVAFGMMHGEAGQIVGGLYIFGAEPDFVP